MLILIIKDFTPKKNYNERYTFGLECTLHISQIPYHLRMYFFKCLYQYNYLYYSTMSLLQIEEHLGLFKTQINEIKRYLLKGGSMELGASSGSAFSSSISLGSSFSSVSSTSSQNDSEDLLSGRFSPL